MSWVAIGIVVLLILGWSLSAKHEEAEEKIEELEGRIQDLEAEKDRHSEYAGEEFDVEDYGHSDRSPSPPATAEVAALLASIDVATEVIGENVDERSAADVKRLHRIRRIIEGLDPDEVAALLES